MSSCLVCSKETRNPKFCSRSCAAIYNNKSTPKRQVEGRCKDCGTPIPASLLYCKSHRPSASTHLDRSINSNQGNNSTVRGNARTVYSNSGRPQACCLCGYDKHVDIAHVKDIRSYPDGTLLNIINASKNLLALCRNHHWEFDHDML